MFDLLEEVPVLVTREVKGETLPEKLKRELLAAEHDVKDEVAKLSWEDRYGRAEKFIDGLTEKEQKALELVMEQIAKRPNEKDKFRKSGEPAVYHCIEVAAILKGKKEEGGMGIENGDVITAAILHDYLEDIKIVRPETFEIESQKIRAEFGDSVWRMVLGMTKFKFDETVHDEVTYGNVLMEASFVPGILLIKLADRLHNWKTIGGQKKLSKRAEAATETEEFFLPIARKIDIQWVIDKLELAVAEVKKEVDAYNETMEEGKRIIIDPKQKAMVEEKLAILFRNGELKEKLDELMFSPRRATR